MLELVKSEPSLGKAIDANKTVLAAEVVFTIREELVRTLTDIVYRRLMLGFDANQGRDLYPAIASIAADELKWSDAQRAAQLDALIAYSDSFVGEY